jgi:hypothetical protein
MQVAVPVAELRHLRRIAPPELATPVERPTSRVTALASAAPTPLAASASQEPPGRAANSRDGAVPPPSPFAGVATSTVRPLASRRAEARIGRWAGTSLSSSADAPAVALPEDSSSVSSCRVRMNAVTAAELIVCALAA